MADRNNGFGAPGIGPGATGAMDHADKLGVGMTFQERERLRQTRINQELQLRPVAQQAVIGPAGGVVLKSTGEVDRPPEPRPQAVIGPAGGVVVKSTGEVDRPPEAPVASDGAFAYLDGKVDRPPAPERQPIPLGDGGVLMPDGKIKRSPDKPGPTYIGPFLKDEATGKPNFYWNTRDQSYLPIPSQSQDQLSSTRGHCVILQ